jgi:hypothetical protein
MPQLRIALRGYPAAGLGRAPHDGIETSQQTPDARERLSTYQRSELTKKARSHCCFIGAGHGIHLDAAELTGFLPVIYIIVRAYFSQHTGAFAGLCGY